MTIPPVADLTELLARVRCLLLDFDGPICAIFAGRPARDVVLELLDVLTTGDAQIPKRLASASDPFDVLRYAATVRPDLAQRVEHVLRLAEIDAAGTATPTAHAADLISAWRQAGRTVAVVSNNSSAAVETYLAGHGIEVDRVVARTSPDASLLKPSPYLVTRAIRALGAEPEACALVGDSPSDIAAAQAAGISTVGYANKPGKHQRLSDAAADVVIDDMQALADAAAVSAVH
jgi:HAD superfamily hydrolase (TIGR01509 family)